MCSAAVLQFGNEMVADVWQSDFFEEIEGQYFDGCAEKGAPAFLFVLNLNEYFVASAPKLHLDEKTACTRVGHLWKLRGDIGPVALASRTHDPTRPPTVAGDETDSMNGPRFYIHEPSADPEDAGVRYGCNRIIETVSEFVLECGRSDHGEG